MNATNSRHWIVITGLFALACLIWGNNGIRGSDQYWYLSDVETLTQDSKPTTNIYYPGIILRNQSTGISEPNYFTHNGPVLHLASVLSKRIDAHSAWKLINILCHCLIAFCIFITCKKYTNRVISTWATCLYLLSPIALWQSMNMLQEQSHAGLMAAILLCYVFRSHKIALVLLAALLAIGTTAHPVFFVLSILFSAYLLVNGVVNRSAAMTIFAIIVAAIYLYLKHKGHEFFPSTFQPNLSAIIAGAVPGKSNILWQLTETPPAITIELMTSKLIDAVKVHFFSLKNIPLFFYTNLSLVALAFLLTTHARKYAGLIIPIVLTYGLYAAILLLMQNQARYQQIIAPLAFTVIALAAYELRHKINPALPALLLAGTAILGGYMAHKNHKDGYRHSIENIELTEKLSFISEESKLVSYDNGNRFDNRFSYILKPRKLLIIRSQFLDITGQNKALSIFEPDYFVSRRPINNDNLPINQNSRLEIATRVGPIYIYKSNI